MHLSPSPFSLRTHYKITLYGGTLPFDKDILFSLSPLFWGYMSPELHATSLNLRCVLTSLLTLLPSRRSVASGEACPDIVLLRPMYTCNSNLNSHTAFLHVEL